MAAYWLMLSWQSTYRCLSDKQSPFNAQHVHEAHSGSKIE
jgi:hypothetical protein